jgi:hypothetical protein
MSIVFLFGATLVGVTLVLWFNIRQLRQKVRGWRSDLIPLFIFSIGSISPRKVTLWTNRGYTEAEARIIVRRQLICLLEFPIGFIVGIALLAVLYGRSSVFQGTVVTLGCHRDATGAEVCPPPFKPN